MTKSQCPRCQLSLTPAGSCESCGGSLTGLSVLKLISPEGYLDRCVAHVKQVGQPSEHACPNCAREMTMVYPPDCDEKLELDFCLQCRVIWFDPSELKSLPKKSRVEKARMAAADMRRDAQRLLRKSEEDARYALDRRDDALTAIILMNAIFD